MQIVIHREGRIVGLQAERFEIVKFADGTGLRFREIADPLVKLQAEDGPGLILAASTDRRVIDEVVRLVGTELHQAAARNNATVVLLCDLLQVRAENAVAAIIASSSRPKELTINQSRVNAGLEPVPWGNGAMLPFANAVHLAPCTAVDMETGAEYADVFLLDITPDLVEFVRGTRDGLERRFTRVGLGIGGIVYRPSEHG